MPTDPLKDGAVPPILKRRTEALGVDTVLTRPENHGDMVQIYQNGVPSSVNLYNLPGSSDSRFYDAAVYAQDTWKLRRLTLSGTAGLLNRANWWRWVRQ